MSEEGNKQRDTEYLLQKQVYKWLRDDVHYDDHGWAQGVPNYNVEEDELRKYLASTGKYSQQVVDRAVNDLALAARRIPGGLRKANIAMAYDWLLFGAEIYDEEKGHKVHVDFINFDNPLANDFYFKSEVSVFENDKEHKRPDIVVYVNGIALVVIELKGKDHDVKEAIRQNITNQSEKPVKMIPAFFTTVAVCIGANEGQGMKLATVGSKEQFYFPWREDLFTAYPEEIDADTLRIHANIEKLPEGAFLRRQLASFLDKRRLLDYIRNFIVVEKGVRKTLRYSQYYAIKRDNVRRERFFAGQSTKNAGIINHTAGSGKTLTMEANANIFLNAHPDGQVVVLVDRTDLQDQNKLNFGWLHAESVDSSSALLDALNDPTLEVIVVLVHKFGHIADRKDGYAAVEKAFSDFAGAIRPRKRLVETDECHRSQSGTLHEAMKRVLSPDETYFTGLTATTNTTDEDRSTLERFGDFVHAYDTAQAEADGAIVPICYETREITQQITDKAQMDARFDEVMANEPALIREKVKMNWANDSRLRSSSGWLNAVYCDIKIEFIRNSRLRNGEGNALLIVPDINRAFAYWALFKDDPEFAGKCYPITSYHPATADLRTEKSEVDGEDVASTTFSLAREMFAGRSEKEIVAFEAELKKTFIEQPDQMKLFILVDRLNTGFDAPSITTVFIDRDIDSTALIFQSVNRANRVEGDKVLPDGTIKRSTKDKAHIVDYSGNYEAYKRATKEYTLATVLAIANGKTTAEALADDGANQLLPASEAFIDAYKQAKADLLDYCSGVAEPKGLAELQMFFCGFVGDLDADHGDDLVRRAALRREFYRKVNMLLRRWLDAYPYYIDEYGAEKTRETDNYVDSWCKNKEAIKMSSGDAFDTKAYDHDMADILDEFVEATEAQSTFKVDDLVRVMNGEVAAADDIAEMAKELARDGQSLFLPLAGKVSKEIRLDRDNISFTIGERLSEKLQQILDRRNKGGEDAAAAARELLELARKVAAKDYAGDDGYPAVIDNNLKIALFDGVASGDELRAVDMFDAINSCYRPSWSMAGQVSDRDFRPLRKKLHDDFHLDRGQMEKVVQLVKANMGDLGK